MPHVLFILPYPSEGASTRLRVEQYLPHLERAGITHSVRPFFGEEAFRVMMSPGRATRKGWELVLGMMKRIQDLGSIDEADLVFVHREALPIGPPLFERRVVRSGVPLVYDFDDAVYLPKEGSLHPWTDRFRNPGKVAEIVRLASLVIAGNEVLAEYARPHNLEIAILPTPIDTDLFRPTGSRTNPTSTIGWIGNPTGIGYLDPLRPVLRRLAKEHEFVVRVIGGRWECPGVAVESKPWERSRDVSDTQSIDIGIMPLSDSPWTRGKCAFKLIQYMSCGKPVVASPVGMNRAVVEDGGNGFLAQTEDEWYERLSALLRDPDLGSRFGEAGRKLVEERYSVEAVAPRFVESLESAMEN